MTVVKGKKCPQDERSNIAAAYTTDNDASSSANNTLSTVLVFLKHHHARYLVFKTWEKSYLQLIARSQKLFSVQGSFQDAPPCNLISSIAHCL